MSSVKYEFRYMPLIGKLSGESMLQQTEQAINEIAKIVNENTAQADIINTLAQDANNNSVEALEKANEALETSSRVYIHESLAVNLDSYCESQLIYVANISSTNLPIAKKGFLEVKTDDDKTECVQAFVSDDKDVYVRSGSITAEPVGDVTVYTADFEEWTSLSSPTILLQAGNGASIPLSADLNDYNTEGTFYCSTTNVGSIVHCPVSEGEFKLIVMKFATANYGLQMLYPIGKHLYVRKYSSDAWGNWEVIVPKITSGITNGAIAVNDTDVAVTGWNAKADLDSPVFIGTPTAPTPAAGDNSTKLATTEFVAKSIAMEPQADWNVTDTTSKAFIKNKPEVLTYEFAPHQENGHTPFKNNCIQSISGVPSEEIPDNFYKWGIQATLGEIGPNSGGNTRIYLPHRGGMYFKNCWNADDGSGWHTVIDDKNFTGYALPKNGTAVKATADAAGNNIQSTYAKKSDLTNYLPLSGGTMTDSIRYVDNGKVFTIGKTVAGNVDIRWAWAKREGAGLALRSTDYSSPGEFMLFARDANNSCSLEGKPDGTLTWNSQPLLPVGVVQAFAGSTIPTGWLLCDGSAVSRTDYAALFNAIGTTYGKGNGSTTFNLPNLTDRFIQGSATAGTVKSAGLPNLTGSIGGGTGAGGPAGSGSGVGFLRDTMINGCFQPSANAYGDETGSGGGTLPSGYPVMTANLDASRSNPIYGNSTTVQPPALTMRYIIKY